VQRGGVDAQGGNDAFGMRRGTTWSGLPTADELDYMWADSSNRGFTDHEHLDNLGLIHINGRVYDPNIGRFLSADPPTGADHAVDITVGLGSAATAATQSFRNSNSIISGTVTYRGFDSVVRSYSLDTAAQLRALMAHRHRSISQGGR